MAVASLSAVHTGITVAQSDRAHQLLQQSAAIVDLIGPSLEGDLLPAEHSVPFACAAAGDMLQELKGDRKSVVSGRRGSGRVAPGCGRIIYNKRDETTIETTMIKTAN